MYLKMFGVTSPDQLVPFESEPPGSVVWLPVYSRISPTQHLFAFHVAGFNLLENATLVNQAWDILDSYNDDTL